MRFHVLKIRNALPKVKSQSRLAVILLGFLGLPTGSTQAAFDLELLGPRAMALGGTGTAIWDDAWAAARNPALIVESNPRVGVSWSQQFGLAELTREAVLVTTATRGQPWAIIGSTFGSDLYRESEFGLALARSVHPLVTVGVEVRGGWLQIQNYSRGQCFAVTAGLISRPTERLSIGACWRNLNNPGIRGYTDRLAESLILGGAFKVSNDGLISADVVQQVRFRTEYRVGAEARVLAPLWIRVGMRAEPVRPSAGIEVAAGRWHFLYATDIHPDLGASHEVGLAIHFQR